MFFNFRYKFWHFLPEDQITRPSTETKFKTLMGKVRSFFIINFSDKIELILKLHYYYITFYKCYFVILIKLYM